MYDQLALGQTIRQQIFEPFLRMNGLPGCPPTIVWDGLSDADAKLLADLLASLSNAGLEPTDEALPTLNERLCFSIQRKAAPLGNPAATMESANGRAGETAPGMADMGAGCQCPQCGCKFDATGMQDMGGGAMGCPECGAECTPANAIMGLSARGRFSGSPCCRPSSTRPTPWACRRAGSIRWPTSSSIWRPRPANNR